MDTLLSQHPLMQPAYITKVIDEIIPDSSEFMLTNEIPTETQETHVIIVDSEQSIGGMTQAVARGAESPPVEYYGRYQMTFTPAHFREKTTLSEADVDVVRRIGTASEFERAQQRMARIINGLRMRVETRLEWLKWEMMKGTVTINQPDVQFTVDYGIPADFTPTLTAGDRWNQTTADPLDDMMEWLDLYRDNGIDPDHFVFNQAIERLLMRFDGIREIHDTFFVSGVEGSKIMGTEVLTRIIHSFTGIPYKKYDKGYYFKMVLKSEVTAVSTSFVVSENPGVVNGDTVTLTHMNGPRAGQVTIPLTSVTGTSFGHAAIGGTTTYPAGSEVRIKKRFLEDDEFIVRGRIPPSATGGPNFAEMIMVPSAYNGGLMNPQPGIFSKTVVDDDGDPPKAELIAGFSGLPVLYHPTTNVVAHVLG